MVQNADILPKLLCQNIEENKGIKAIENKICQENVKKIVLNLIYKQIIKIVMIKFNHHTKSVIELIIKYIPTPCPIGNTIKQNHSSIPNPLSPYELPVIVFLFLIIINYLLYESCNNKYNDNYEYSYI